MKRFLHKSSIFVAFALAFTLILTSCSDTSRRSVAGIPDPIQKEAQGGTEFDYEGYHVSLKYLYSYEIEALVVSAHDYNGSSIDCKLIPRDFALAWGQVAEYNDRINFHWSQSNRWYYWRTNTYDEIAPIGGEAGVGKQSANNHLIPKDATVRSAIESINAGDHIKITGYLVNLEARNDKANDVIWWNSSTTRDDTGDGACEVVYVTGISKID